MLPMTTLVTRWCVVLLLVASTVGCDVVTKRLAAENLAGFPAQSFLGDTVRLSYAENAGGFDGKTRVTRIRRMNVKQQWCAMGL